MNEQDHKYPRELIRFISGNYSPEDEKVVQRWLREDSSRQKVLEDLKDVWELTGRLDIGNEEQAWTALKNNTLKRNPYQVSKQHGRKRRSSLNIWMKVAAVLLVVAGAYGFYRYSITGESGTKNNEQAAYHSVTSDKGERVRVRIKDGTKVVLNASSKIYYEKDYGKSSRVIYLEGEAYFEVNNDHPFPFVVYANGARVEDISTKFDVKAYKHQQDTEVIVSEGKVKVSPKQKVTQKQGTDEDTPSVLVPQGQMVKIRADAPNQLQVEKADLHKALGWLQDQLVFDADPLSQIIKEIEPYYGVKIKVEDPALLNKRITASFDNESLENVVKVLTISMEANYSIEGDTVRFYSK